MNKKELVIRIGQPRQDTNMNRTNLLITEAMGCIVLILGYMIRRDPKNDSDVQLGTNLERMGGCLAVGSTLCALAPLITEGEISYDGKVIK